MATGVAPAVANADLDSRGAAFPWIKLHVGDPGAAGTANAATNTTRKQASWASAAGGAIATNAELRWDNVPASEDYTHWTGWSASSGGTVGWSGTVTADPMTSSNNFVIASGGLTFTHTVMA